MKPWGCLCCQPEARGLLPGAAELSASWLSGDEGEAGPELSLKSRMLGSLLCCQARTIPHTLFPTAIREYTHITSPQGQGSVPFSGFLGRSLSLGQDSVSFPRPSGQELPPPSDPQGTACLSPQPLQTMQGLAPAPWPCSALAGQEVLTAWLTMGRQPPVPAITSPNSSGHLTRPPPALGQGPVPRTCKPGSCRDFRRRGPLGLTLSLVCTLLGSMSESWSICHGKGGDTAGSRWRGCL